MNIKKIKPMFTAVVVTANIYPRDYKEHNIISPKANKLKASSISDKLIRMKEAEARVKHGWVTIQGANTVVTE